MQVEEPEDQTLVEVVVVDLVDQEAEDLLEEILDLVEEQIQVEVVEVEIIVQTLLQQVELVDQES
jgi:hypothetical protein